MAARVILLALPLLVAGCMEPPKITAPAPVAKPPPVIVPPAPARPLDWHDGPLNPGAWRYEKADAGSVARFGIASAVPDFELRCDLAARSISLSRPGMAGGKITVTTSYGARSWPATVSADGRVMVVLVARDPFLDQLAFSRARFAIEGPGPAPRLILPAWAEPIRVIEDCRA